MAALVHLGQKAIQDGPRLLCGESMQVEVALVGKLPISQATHQTPIEADDSALRKLGCVRDVEIAGAGNQL